MENCYRVTFIEEVTNKRYTKIFPLDFVKSKNLSGKTDYQNVLEMINEIHGEVRIIEFQYIPENYTVSYEKA